MIEIRILKFIGRVCRVSRQYISKGLHGDAGLICGMLVLFAGGMMNAGVTVWTDEKTEDAEALILGVETRKAGNQSRLFLELDVGKVRADKPLKLVVLSAEQSPVIRITDEKGVAVPYQLAIGGRFVQLEAGEVTYQEIEGFEIVVADSEVRPYLVVIETAEGKPVEKIEIHYEAATFEMATSRLNLAPQIASPRHEPQTRSPRAYERNEGFVLENTFLRAEFSTVGGQLRVKSLTNEYAGKNILMDPRQSHVFLTEIEGKRFGAEDWQIRGVQVVGDNQVQLEMGLADYGLVANFTLTIEEQGLRFGLEVENQSRQERAWKVAFPQLGGMSISEKPENDYYLFPLRGGLIQNTNANLRSYYGANIAWWQMVHLYSPEQGTGVSIRSLDEEGLYKGITLRKGKTNPAFATMTKDASVERVEPGYVWEQSLPGGEGTAFTIEYPQYKRAAGQRMSYPDAVLEMHPGDWHQAMRVYADWARDVWDWRPMNTGLRDVWNIQVINNSIVAGGQAPDLFKDGQWYQDYADNSWGMSEFGGWWEWQEKGPFGTSLANARKEVGERFAARSQLDSRRNPATGKLAWAGGGRGDYDEPVSWGGWPAMRQSVDAAHQAGKLVGLYTSPFLASNESRIGSRGRELAVINPYLPSLPRDALPTAPREGYLIRYMVWVMCIDQEEYQDFVAQQIADMVKNSGVDMVRLDQIGVVGWPCFHPDHNHMYAEPGHHAWMRATNSLIRKTREATEKVNPHTLLMGEYPGNDRMSAELDGTLTYELHFWSYADLRVLPINVFRFYFPEIKLYEHRPNLSPEIDYAEEVAFWNGVGAFLRLYPDAYQRVLEENGNAFDSQDVEPLIPTLETHVYANRFSSEDKDVILLFNDRESEVSGNVLQANDHQHRRYFDLFAGRELNPVDGRIHLDIPSKSVAAVARFTRTIDVESVHSRPVLAVRAEVEEASWQVCNPEGKVLKDGSLNEVNSWLSSYAGKEPLHVKLFSGKYLIDATNLP